MEAILSKIQTCADRLYNALSNYQLDAQTAETCLWKHGSPYEAAKKASSTNVALTGGVIDPIDGALILDHYATSHFGWSSTLRWLRNDDFESKNRALSALEFVGRVAVSPLSKSIGFHWDFKNLAFLEAMSLLRNHDKNLDHPSIELSHKFVQSGSLGINWFAMRSRFHSLLYDECGGICRWIKSVLNLLPVLASCRKDGSIDDFLFTSKPIQYSLYSACLLSRNSLLSAHKRELIVSKALKYLFRYVLPTGQFNYRGRGHEQIFGYATALYLLIFSLRMQNQSPEFNCLNLLDTIATYLVSFQGEDGLFPLVLNKEPSSSKWGYYDYHFQSVYNSFLSAWLELALYEHKPNKASPPLPSKTQNVCSTKIVAKQNDILFQSKPNPFDSSVQVWHGIGSGTVSISSQYYQCLFSSGETRYLADCGISPHAFWVSGLGTIFSCPGGPTPKRYGVLYRKGDVTSNFFCPITRHEQCTDWISPATGSPGKCFVRTDDTLEMSYKKGTILWLREVKFYDKEIHFQDKLRFSSSFCGEVRMFNLPLLSSICDRTMIDGTSLRITDNERISRVLIEADFEIDNSAFGICRNPTENPLGNANCVALTHPMWTFSKGDEIVIYWKLYVE